MIGVLKNFLSTLWTVTVSVLNIFILDSFK